MSASGVAIVTDSTADIAAEIAAENEITVVPLAVSFGADTFVDGDLTQEQFFARMAIEPRLPTTSQPPPGAFEEAYARLLETASSVVSIHISNRLSGTIESARQAAERFGDRVTVIDSLNLSWGLALQVVEAARAARAGSDVAAIAARVADARKRLGLIVGLDSLDNLARGGRIGRVSAFLGSVLDIKVTLCVDEQGEFQPVGRDRGERAAITRTLAWVERHMGAARRGSFAVGHAMGLERARGLADALRERYEVDELVIYEAGSVICAHTGSGWGVAVLPAT